ncbi:MAG: hypothetical protein WA786_10840, partial [Acidimicrobiales bacterium]
HNPTVTPTRALLAEAVDGGPYLLIWPDYGGSSYVFSLNVKGVLLLAIPANSKAVEYKGPASCDALN